MTRRLDGAGRTARESRLVDAPQLTTGAKRHMLVGAAAGLLARSSRRRRTLQAIDLGATTPTIRPG